MDPLVIQSLLMPSSGDLRQAIAESTDIEKLAMLAHELTTLAGAAAVRSNGLLRAALLEGKAVAVDAVLRRL